MIKVHALCKQYGPFKAVDNISLNVEAGEICGFLGINGAGKTTTLKMLAGLLKPTSGQIYMAGIDMLREPTKAKAIIGYVPDRPYLYPRLTGREFLYFVADLYKVDRLQVDQRIDQLLSEYSLEEWQDELIESYSHGMKQRLATCSALIHQPKVLIVDEPMVGLDPHGALKLKSALRSYANNGMAIILSTHSLNIAEEVASRMVIVHKGRIITMGSLHHIREQTGRCDQDLEQIFLQITSSYSE